MVWVVSLLSVKVIPHGLTPGVGALAFAVWLGSVGSHPLAHPEPYLQRKSPKAAPKSISGRTSYLLVRLAFHRYPQLIPQFCIIDGFGPPLGCYPSFTLAMGRSPGFGSTPSN